jgi:hypothetical protein
VRPTPTTTAAFAALLSLLGGFGAGCASTAPPERLVGVSAELEQPAAQELADSQPNLVREARDHRDAAWQAVEDGDEGLAEAHAWAAWLRLRTAENVDVIAQRDALAGAAGAAGVEALGDLSPLASGTPVATDPTDDLGGTGIVPASGTEAGAARAVREAEDAMLRLLATGLEPDPRWSEAQALLQAAQRALERAEFERAEALGARASFVFEVVRLTRLGGSGYATGGEALTPRGLAMPAGPATPAAPADAAPLAAASATPATTPSRGTPNTPSSSGTAGAASPDITVNVPGAAPSLVPIPTGSGEPTVVVVPGAAPVPAPAPSEPRVGEEERDADSAPRSRIVTDVLQPIE